MPEKQYISIREAAQLTGYNPTTFNNLCARGKLDAYKNDKSQWRVSEESLKAYFSDKDPKTLKPKVRAYVTGKPYKEQKSTPAPDNSKDVEKKDTEIFRLQLELTAAQDALTDLKTEHETTFEELKANHVAEIDALKQSFEKEKTTFFEAAKTVSQQQLHIEKLTDQIEGYASFLKDTLTRLLPTPNNDHNP